MGWSVEHPSVFNVGSTPSFGLTLMSWGQDSHSDSRTTFRFDGSHLVTVQNMS